ncbi:tRNA (adenosine(37)-N6)-threonylcarbamoyltransferase complex dimerization subunit type 1 TsaB [Rhodoblastus acidophilus]|uniref:tRNA (Adenosine(37)-N6)-threonylcarbamoyltransferase complex dimerization subunit type 1 TsaB n=1 Tax=Candidatus Rhodoblastus alkanivorans TaxID=2954117 RepID=A0ABS9Z2B2_9HYPH|nr:tRNA (adenosine(37)-N6)-threonylcarbamoyltransferase complex dimerization subunit type 1 TsaB [Candidatus Rhodoblastus alkanivorans]MCI4679447.1 tRNA (adenosine(37)-N6)-threonylcarbamoyltransferase complex dimerization subunit type 1 TsaB [Candidatus Rhodoblastus alkanivorans]MCI4681455.1 tRNA (adenosine(37)-N6)-threonylcarbamoyltransferase complex dimerization subunit type 1 TsaB [Candidatus Rhodoblastus alkanivorans]MDI4642503.1 tRNA (adenosine(37)-N6)-threonylcarbamoyltransferase complex d
MRILAIDTALPAVSVCVLDDGAREPVAIESIPVEKGHAEALLPMIERVMAKVGGGFSSIGRVAVTVGPGSFTGIRIGVAAARGIALACGVETVGVSTLAAFAAPLLDRESDGIVATAIDARHGNVFFSAYGPAGRVLASPRILPLREACRLLSGSRVRAAGSGAYLLREEAAAFGGDIAILNGSPAPDIMAVARLGLAAAPENAPARPIYLKAADAQPTVQRSLPRVTS